MTDFEKMIRDMVANGTNPEDIAKTASDTLNTIKREKTDKKDKRTAHYTMLKNEFNKDYDNSKLANQRMTMKDVAILAALVVAPSYPNWTKEDIDEFMNGVEETLKVRAAVVGKDPIDGMFTILDKFAEMSEEKAELKYDVKCEVKDSSSDKYKYRYRTDWSEQ